MFEKGDLIGDYKLDKFLGRGQFGEVWLAEKQLQFSTRKVRHALKFLINTGDEIDFKSAEAEIDTWIEASGHPNVMSVIDMRLERGYLVIISEFAEGGSLKGWLGKNGGKAPNVEKALEMMVGILRGIEHLHAKSVVHRDLKPDNILLQGNFPRITDFGISRIVSTGSMSTKAMGSPAYMSPESFKGNKAPQNDIWSAGVILYEMLTGGYPFSAETIYGLVNAIQIDELKPLPPEIFPELREIVERALQKDPQKRFQTASDMRLAVEKIIYQLKIGSVDTAATVNAADPKPDFDGRLELADTIQSIVDDPQPDTVTVADAVQPRQDFERTQPSRTDRFSEEQTRTGFVKFDDTAHAAEQAASDGQRAAVNEKKGSAAESVKADYREPFYIAAAVIGGLLLIFFGGLIAMPFIWSVPDGVSNENIAEANKSAPANTAANLPTSNEPGAPGGMVYVPGGEFMMGRDFADMPKQVPGDELYLDENPAHRVTVKPFFIDIYEVTNEQYAEFVRATNHRAPRGWTDGRFPAGRDRFPVVNIEFDDAAAFARWAGKRLPTEEEWEFAARGTDKRLYPWGNVWDRRFANVESGDFAEVGSFKAGASPFGVYDMVGNAWEWTSSDFKAYPNGTLTKVYNEKKNLKTLRGNTITAGQHLATATFRLGYGASGERDYSRTGFRCVKDIAK